MSATHRRLSAVLAGTTMPSAEDGSLNASPPPAPAPAASSEPIVLSGGFTSEIDAARTLFGETAHPSCSLGRLLTGIYRFGSSDGAKVGGITALGPGAASDDLLVQSSAVMATAAATALTATGSESLLQYGPVRGDGRYIRELSKFLSKHYAEPVDAAHLTLTAGATSVSRAANFASHGSAFQPKSTKESTPVP